VMTIIAGRPALYLLVAVTDRTPAVSTPAPEHV
jgi:hypothetical protein